MPSSFKGTPAKLGAFLTRLAHEKILPGPSVNELRGLLSEERVPAEKREAFDDGLLLLLVFTAYVSARRKFPIHLAEQLLAGELSPLLCGRSQADSRAIQERIDVYRKGCPGDGTRVTDLGELLFCFLWELYDDHEARDPVFNFTVSRWIAGVMKTFDDFMDEVEFTER